MSIEANYEKIYQNFWNECLEVAKKDILKDKTRFTISDVIDRAGKIFEETANAEQIVGYYIEFNGKYAYQQFKDETKDIDYTEKFKEADMILKKLYQPDGGKTDE